MVQVQPRERVLFTLVDQCADDIAPTGRHDLDNTDQASICPAWQIWIKWG